MKKLNKILAPALLAALAFGAANPAAAQMGAPMGRHTPMRADQIRAQINDLQMRIDRNQWGSQRISPREAAGLRNDVRNLQATFRAYNRNGLDGREMATLNGRIENIRTRLHIEARDWNNRRW